MDGEEKELPELEGIVLLNIQTWGAGVRPWELGHHPPESRPPEQAFDDGQVEVIGLYSSFHIAQLQVGLSEPHRFGQAKQVVLKIKPDKSNTPLLPMQVDGEPWLQGGALITVTHRGQAHILASPDYHNPPAIQPENNGGFFLG